MTTPFITWKSELPSVILLGCVAVLSAYFSKTLPERVAIHWNMAGEVDGWASRSFTIWFFPLMALGMYLLLLSVWRLDPNRSRYIEFAFAYHAVKTFSVAFLFLVYLFVGLFNLGYPISISFVIPVLIGVLFVGIGYVLPKTKQNWMFGIRTPWTLSSEEVWDKAHRIGGRSFIIGGCVVIGASFIPAPWSTVLIFISIFLAILFPVVYSYILFRRSRFDSSDE